MKLDAGLRSANRDHKPGCARPDVRGRRVDSPPSRSCRCCARSKAARSSARSVGRWMSPRPRSTASASIVSEPGNGCSSGLGDGTGGKPRRSGQRAPSRGNPTSAGRRIVCITCCRTGARSASSRWSTSARARASRSPPPRDSRAATWRSSCPPQDGSARSCRSSSSATPATSSSRPRWITAPTGRRCDSTLHAPAHRSSTASPKAALAPQARAPHDALDS